MINGYYVLPWKYSRPSRRCWMQQKSKSRQFWNVRLCSRWAFCCSLTSANFSSLPRYVGKQFHRNFQSKFSLNFLSNDLLSFPNRCFLWYLPTDHSMDKRKKRGHLRKTDFWGLKRAETCANRFEKCEPGNIWNKWDDAQYGQTEKKCILKRNWVFWVKTGQNFKNST